MEISQDLVIQILNDITAIKWILVLIGVFVAVAAFSIAFGLYFVYTMANTVADRIEETTRSKFSDEAARLFEENRLGHLIEVAKAKIADRPNHTYAHWYLAKAYFQQGRIHDAKREFEMVRDLNPPWSAAHVTPYIEQLEHRIQQNRPELVE
jgi:cytochrome c-type biogenesis protein CcmH/NrfG